MITLLMVFALGLVSGIILRSLIDLLLPHSFKYNGTIRVLENTDKLSYLLELEDDPESLKLQKAVTFKVDTSALSLNRE